MSAAVTVLSGFALTFAVAMTSGCAVRWPDGRASGESLGGPANGSLLRAVRVPDHARSMVLFRRPGEGGQVWTTRRLRDAVLSSAERVARTVPGGAPLVVGDFSAPWGGRIERHRSHRNGRDVDLLFYVTDASSGRSVQASGFVRFDRALEPRVRDAAVRFDLPRNWALVESLVREERHGVLWIFCASWIRAALLQWAEAHGRDPRWIERAARALHQPGDAAPHDDHFHVRVSCSPEDRLIGCVDGGPMHFWLGRAVGKPDAAPMDDQELRWELPPPPHAHRGASRRTRRR
jgi:penicillin-insensitive murein endopeptidase